VVASTVLRKMGKANPSAQDDVGGVFSPETYLTRWNTLAPEAKSALFEGVDPLVTRDLNRLAEAMNLQRKAARALPNPSGTAVNTTFWSLANAMGGGLVGLASTGPMGAAVGGAAGTMAAHGTAKLLAERVFTNPRMIRWLVKQTTVPLGALKQELAILAKDAEGWDPESQSIASDMAQHFTNVDWRSMLLATAVADQTR
jgi:hypothetical protein